MTSLNNWINQGHGGPDIVAPIKARACDAWRAVRRSQSSPAGSPRLMQQGAERC